MLEPERVVVIGGSAAGPKAAAKARRVDQHAEITIIQKNEELSMAACGYPYYVGGVFDNRNQLISTPTGVVRNPSFFMNAKGIRALNNTEVTAIDRDAHTVACRNLETGEESTVPYDKLVIATGATPVVPPIPGIDLKGVTTLQSLRDADYLREIRNEGKVTKAVIMGGGLIGVESAEALAESWMKVTLVELLPQILSFLSWDFAKIVENHMREKGVDVVTDNGVAEFTGKDGRLASVRLRSGAELPCELAVVAVGVKPNVRLAADAGISIGDLGGIAVDDHMRTSDPDIYAAGDCIEVKHRITGANVLAPFGDLANLEGRVAGQNVIPGNNAVFPGTILTGVCKVFEYSAGSTGLSEEMAERLGYTKPTISVVTTAPDKPHFMDGKPIIMKMVADAESGRVLGVQAVGPGDVSKRLAASATAIMGGLTVADLVNADLPYAPPFSPALDNLVMTAHVLENKMLGRLKGITSVQLKERLDAGEDIFLLDVRGPDEFEEMRLGIGEKLIPLGMLRKRLDELPENKDHPVVCYCKISLRGYEAASLLISKGWTSVRVLEGGILAWPYPREK